MCDLKSQYHKIKTDIDAAILEVLESTAFINGKKVTEFAVNLAAYTGTKHCIPCANGTDALQIALMALGLQPGDEVIVPAFTYVASAEVIGLLKLTPVLVDVDYNTFNVTAELIEPAITPKTKAIIPVHLFGQSCDMEPILKLAQKHNIHVIEDNAQALSAVYTFPDGTKKHTGTMGIIGCTSFFPSKNLGCYGDGGAMFTDNDELAKAMRMIASHGQSKKYIHTVIGCNSRLDTLQAAILDVKLKHLNEYSQHRFNAAQGYNEGLKNVPGIVIPEQSPFSSHVYHQYTLKVLNGKREELKNYLQEKGVPSMIYYPLPLNEQEAFKSISKIPCPLTNSNKLCNEVLSIPIDTEIERETQLQIISIIADYLRSK